jgi:chromosome segregation ATPase
MSEIRSTKSDAYLKKSSSGNFFASFIFLLVLIGIFAIAYWQYTEAKHIDKSMLDLDNRLMVLEDQLKLVDEINNDSLTGISANIQFLDKEIRKLWDLSNKRNKVNIAALQKNQDSLMVDLSIATKSVSDIDNDLKFINSEITSLKQLSDENSMTLKNLSNYEEKIKLIETQLFFIEDNIQALENYKKQINQVLLEIQTDITQISDNNTKANEVVDKAE